jgi:hypothetical protein
MQADPPQRVRALPLLLIGLLLLLLHDSATAQASVSLHLRQPPPHQLRFTDLWEVDIINPGAALSGVQLVAVVRTASNQVVLTSTTAPFVLPTGIKVITAGNSASLSPIQTQYTAGGYRDIVTRTSQFPAGSYTLCVTARLTVATRAADLAADCIDQQVVSDVPPLLIVPANESTVTEPFPVFTWTWGGAGQPDTRVTYTMKMVELLGSQSPAAAMQRNLSWFEQDGLRSTVLQYPPAARPLRPGQQYAWMVTAFTFDQPAGQSEVWSFTFQPPQQKPPVQLLSSKEVLHLDVLQELLKSCSGSP